MRFKKGLAGAASVGALLVAGALAPSTALAHPCMANVEAAMGKTLTLHTGGNWAGWLPTWEEHECAEDFTSEAYKVSAANASDAAADPVEDAVATFDYTENMTPLGYSARVVPTSGAGNGLYNSDLAFKDNLVIAGTYAGFRILDVTDKSNPVEIINYTGCAVGQGDVIVYGNLLIRSWDSPSNSMCAGQMTGAGFEGIHIFDISNPAEPRMVRQLRMASSGNEPGAPSGCGSHTATAVPDPARGYLYIYNGGSSGSCNGIDIVRIKLSDPTDATFLRRVSHGRNNQSCHDNNVIMNVGGGTVGYAMCAGGNGLAMYAFDMAKPADEPGTPASPGGVEIPTLLWSRTMTSVTTGHSGSFTYDGKYLVYGHEPGGGSQAQCQATSTVINRSLYFMDPLTGDIKGTMLHPRPQTNRENCTWHNFNVVPTKKGYLAVSGSYQSGISVIDFTNVTAPKEIAYADPAPLSPTSLILGGDWSTYWHNGYIYESDIRRGVITWKIDEDALKLSRTNTFAESNPQTQMISYEPDYTPASVSFSAPTDGGGYTQGADVTVSYSCADASGIESCEGDVPSGGKLDTSTIGAHEFTVNVVDGAGNESTETVTYLVNSTDVEGGAGATVPATLSLTLGAPVTFGAFVPGLERTYTASTTANVISTAGDATLSVADTGANPGHLVNGAFALPQPLQGLGVVKTYDGPVSNDQATVTFTQAIGASDALRTGTYSKTLTFTLSTTNP
jgi:hypothetical protein